MEYEFTTGAPITEAAALAQVAAMGFHGLAFDDVQENDETLHWHEFASVAWVISGTGSFADEHGNVGGEGDIGVQPRNVFEAVTRVLEEGGATWRDVVKLNTYYCCNETGDAVKAFWEKMTRIRLEYLPTPGPAGTAVRVAGLMYDGFLIEVEAIAVVGSGDLPIAP